MRRKANLSPQITPWKYIRIAFHQRHKNDLNKKTDTNIFKRNSTFDC